MYILNVQYKTVYTVSQIVYYFYRVFPLGRYVKVTVKDSTTVGNVHLVILNDGSEYLMNWHASKIEEIIQTVVVNTTSTTTTTETVVDPATMVNTTTVTDASSSTHINVPEITNTTTTVVENTTHIIVENHTSSTETSSTVTPVIPSPEQLINRE